MARIEITKADARAMREIADGYDVCAGAGFVSWPVLHVVRMFPDILMPRYQAAGAAGIDLHAYLPPDIVGDDTSVEVLFGETTKIRTGIKVAIPAGHEGQIRGRSGRAFYDGVFAFNGTIDNGFTGELMVLLTGTREGYVHSVKHGDRIAQLVVSPVARCAIVEVATLAITERGENGLGSTGV